MLKKFSLFIILICFLFSACSKNVSVSSSKNTQNTEETAPTSESSSKPVENISEPLYFESDSIVDKFFNDYNSIAEIKIPADEIEKGNIRTKALVYIEDLSLEIINANDFLSISMGSSPENEFTTLYAVFRDSIKAMRADITDLDIQSAWDTIHESGYLVEDYAFNDISITYVPSKELSWGTSDPSIDLEIPLQ